MRCVEGCMICGVLKVVWYSSYFLFLLVFFCLKDFLWLGCRGGCIIFLPWQTGAALTLLMNTEQTLSALQKVYKCFFHSHLCLYVAFSNLLQFCSEWWPCINFALLHYNQALLDKGSPKKRSFCVSVIVIPLSDHFDRATASRKEELRILVVG